MKINICFADLVHTGHSCIAVPYGISVVASYCLKEIPENIEVDLFKSPDDLVKHLEQKIPQIVCFSNYIWNLNISCEIARQIKTKSPDTVIIFGGPNYPINLKEQEAFLLSHPYIDFYIYREGEQAFVELFKKLSEFNFNDTQVKENRLNINSCHYINSGEIVRGDLSSPLSNLDEIPSPYLSGLCDKFLDKALIPIMQTSRGCPFKCTYCQEGGEHYNLRRRYSLQRIKDELEYIAKRAASTDLHLSDSNFGMYKEDIEICKEIASIQEEFGWPQYFDGIDGKNNKSRVLEAASIVKGSHLTAAVQSTDSQVLKNIKRQNVSLDQMVQVAKAGKSVGASSCSEVILCLPGDSKEAHFKTISDLIDAEIDMVRSHQFIMLPGSEASTLRSREEYGMTTRFRVTPKTVSYYRFFGSTFIAPEIDEICVANDTMSFSDYLECRCFNLTVEIFYNNGILQELLKFVRLNGLLASTFIDNIHSKIKFHSGPLSKLYDDFLKESKELWSSRDEAKAFLQQPNVVERYISGELGNNEQLMYRALAIYRHMDELHKVSFDVAREILKRNGSLKEENHDYLTDLEAFSLLRKQDILSDKVNTKEFHYDFVKLMACDFNDNPLSNYKPEGLKIEFKHTDKQKELISDYVKTYGLSNYGLGNILSSGSQLGKFYRNINVVL